MPRVSSVHRQVPAQPWYLNDWITVFVGGFVSFSTVAVELHYVITSVWRSQMLGMFFFLLLNLNLLMCVVGLVSVLTTYLKLQAQEWAWWWRSFWTGYSTSIWCFLYCLWHMSQFAIKDFWSDLVFLLYAMLFSNLFGLMCAMISVLASWIFVTFLYSQSKSD